MDNFKSEHIRNNNENRYQNTPNQDLHNLHQELSKRFNLLMSEPVHLDTDLNMNMSAAEIMRIQHDILEIEQELKTRKINN